MIQFPLISRAIPRDEGLNKEAVLTTSQAQGMLIGLALGDALGQPVEGLSLSEIKARYGQTGIQEPPDPALSSGHTRSSVALAEALIEAGEGTVDELKQAFDRQRGQTRSKADEADGSSPAARVAPLGYFYQHDADRLWTAVRSSSRVVDEGPALVASVGVAYLVKLALDDVAPQHFLRQAYEFSAGASEAFEQALRRVGQVVNWGDEIAAMRHIGAGWESVDVVALALYCVMRYPDDYVSAVRRAANSNGDSGAVACITGEILGAHLGLDAIPAAWRARCTCDSALVDLGARLAAGREAMEANLGD